MPQSDDLRDDPAHRHADDVRPLDFVGIEYVNRVVCHVLERIARIAQLKSGRAADIAIVVANDKAARVRQPLAKWFLPPDERRLRPHNQQNSRIGRIAEAFRAKLHAISIHHLFGHSFLLLQHAVFS